MADPLCPTARFATVIGDMAVVWQTRPFLVRRLLLPGDFSEELPPAFMDAMDFRPLPEELLVVIRLVRDILLGAAAPVPWDLLAWDGYTDLERAVYAETAAIPPGGLATYKEIARRIDRPRACRFVGNALSKNPFPILIPCHRVIRSDTKTGGFTAAGGTILKQRLIDAEAGLIPCAP